MKTSKILKYLKVSKNFNGRFADLETSYSSYKYFKEFLCILGAFNYIFHISNKKVQNDYHGRSLSNLMLRPNPNMLSLLFSV